MKERFDRENFNGNSELPFRVRVGRGRESRTDIHSQKFLSRVNAILRTQGFRGKTYGVKSGRGTFRMESGFLSQRVLIKARVVRSKSSNSSALAKHLLYLERSGVGLDGGEAKAFSEHRPLEQNDMRSIAKEWSQDRHHFRFIVSPEYSEELNLEQVARDLVKGMEKDLKTRLEWLSVAHYNTDNPHFHLLIRGKDEHGADLIINRDYISKGLRFLAQEITTKELGPRTELDVYRSLQRSIYERKLTQFDRELEQMRLRSGSGEMDLRCTHKEHGTPFTKRRNFQLQRLAYLETLGLATEVQVGVWRVAECFVERLQELGLEGDIIKTMHARMKNLPQDLSVRRLDMNGIPSGGITGRIIHRGLVDELQDTPYIVMQGKDGHSYYLPLTGRTEYREDELRIGKDLHIDIDNRARITKADQNIERYCAAHNGLYDAVLHSQEWNSVRSSDASPSAEEYAANHRRRARTLVRMGLAEEVSPGVWRIANNLSAELSKQREKVIVIQSLERKLGVSMEIT